MSGYAAADIMADLFDQLGLKPEDVRPGCTDPVCDYINCACGEAKS